MHLLFARGTLGCGPPYKALASISSLTANVNPVPMLCVQAALSDLMILSDRTPGLSSGSSNVGEVADPVTFVSQPI